MGLVVVDSHIREDILKNGISDTVVSASAGAGKTTIMIEKIKHALELEETHKTIAAITFTIKATSEIRERLRDIDINKEIMISTNDNFVEVEIIRPFLTDTLFGENMSNDFIIKYSGDIESYSEGIKKLKQENILGSYQSDLRKNFKFELAKNILLESTAARQYLESKYRMLFLDEYQDSDSEMHELFMYIKKGLNIRLFIVGDEKQAIYIWRGAYKNIFDLLSKEKFSRYTLTHNFRCHPEITNFSNFVHHLEYYNPTDKLVSNMILCKTKLKLDVCLQNLILTGELDSNKEITVLINVNRTAEKFARDLKKLGYDFIFIPRTPIDEGLLNAFLLRQLANLYFDPYFSIYDFCEALKIDNELKQIKIYEKLFRALIDKEDIDYEKVKMMCDKFVEMFEFSISEEEIAKLTETITNPAFEICFVRNESKFKVMTVFGAKGLEFDQVVAFGREYNLYDEERRNSHYVAVTRAKEKMIIINETDRYIQELAKVFVNQGLKTKDEVKKVIKVINI
ncbi:ATP-dependent helicase [Sporosarcina psychrophila]|uniref:ATP-dependent helicase n=1 Tax=Sporosarcina psychrophila TaxID=1476 RepID=UPI0030CFDBD7